MASNNLTIRVSDMPEVLWELRRMLAQLLRDEADGEPEIVAKKLRGLAARFEAAVNEEA